MLSGLGAVGRKGASVRPDDVFCEGVRLVAIVSASGGVVARPGGRPIPEGICVRFDFGALVPGLAGGKTGLVVSAGVRSLLATLNPPDVGGDGGSDEPNLGSVDDGVSRPSGDAMSRLGLAGGFVPAVPGCDGNSSLAFPKRDCVPGCDCVRGRRVELPLELRESPIEKLVVPAEFPDCASGLNRIGGDELADSWTTGLISLEPLTGFTTVLPLSTAGI